MDSDFSDRLAKIRALHFPVVQVVTPKPFPLKSLLTLYIKNESVADYDTSMYTEYFYAFRALVNWLAPIEIPECKSIVHPILMNYEINKIAEIVGCDSSIIWHTFREVLDERYSSINTSNRLSTP